MNEFSTKNIIKGNAKLQLLSKTNRNNYKFNIIKVSPLNKYFIFSIHSVHNELPYECESINIRNGIYNYYIDDITVSLEFILDNNLWHFLKIDISKYLKRVR